MKKNLFIFVFSFFLFSLVFAQEPPVLLPIGNKKVDFGETLTFKISATDPSGRPVFYEAANLPYGAYLDPRSGEFRWTPTIYQVGTHRITFNAWDRMTPGRMASETIEIQVVYRKTFSEKAWGLGLKPREVIFETTELEDLYPEITKLEVEGKNVLDQQIVWVTPDPKIVVEVRSPYRIDPKTVAVTLDGKELKIKKLSPLKVFGAKRDILELVFEPALRNLSPKQHELMIMVGNELGISTHHLVLEVRREPKT